MMREKNTIKMKMKKQKVVKGISLSADIVELIMQESKSQHRSFSSQAEYIIENWVKEHLKKGRNN